MSTVQRPSQPTRRTFLTSTAAALVLGQSAPELIGAEPAAKTPAPELKWLTEHLAVFPGPINTGVLRDGQKLLVIDCGDASVAPALRGIGSVSIEQLLFTHHHRDQACGAPAVLQQGTRVGVPATEREWFEGVEKFWSDPKYRWHLYSQHPHHLMLTRPLKVDAAYRDGDEFRFGPAKIRVLATPGHTDGAVSYLVEVDGKRVVFCGDCLYDKGRLWEMYSLQKGERNWTDYHGFLGARGQLVESLRRIEAARPDLLVPSHGCIMDEPAEAIHLLVERLGACYEKYVAISALKFYDRAMAAACAGLPGQMPVSPALPVPGCLRHSGTTWVLISKDKAALVMDCGAPGSIEEVKKLMATGEVRKVEGLWVTHYHDDHVDSVPAFQKEFDCPCITDRSVAEVISDPAAWRIPCISPSKARVDRPTKDGETWQWHEFKLTAYHFPGQTLYHAGLMAETGGLRMFFVGDSFTPSGIDDYCVQNRNFLGPGVGFDRCLALLEKLQPTHMFNPHVNPAFTFTAEQYRAMRTNLAEREKLFGELFPWDHANFGMDDSWVRCHPYQQRVSAGGEVNFEVVITNHSAEAREAQCRAVSPWKTDGGGSGGAWRPSTIPAKSEGRISLSLRAAADARSGRHVVAVDVCFGPWILPQWTEAVVVV